MEFVVFCIVCIVCSVLAYGVNLYRLQMDSIYFAERNYRKHCKESFTDALFGPVSLLIFVLADISMRKKLGLMYRNPHNVKIPGTAENWESGKLGMSSEHVKVSDLTV